MKLNKPTANFYIPNEEEVSTALLKTTHMAIAAHQDDIEIMAYHGIEACFQNTKNSFTGVVVTNGGGSAREGLYKDYSNEDMINVRRKEQRKAAYLGEFGALVSLDYPSKEVKEKLNESVIQELVEIIKLTKPTIIYTHNLADKHDTHIGVVTKVIKALRLLPTEYMPQKLYGCEVWRNLDWVNDEEKVLLDVSGHPNVAASLVEVFDSQIIGGKRYDLATIGRRLSNATFGSSHQVDDCNAVTYAMDLTPLILDKELDIVSFVTSYIDRFKRNVADKIAKTL